MCRLPPTGVYRYKYSMRNFTGLESALLVVSTLQLAGGITLLVINSMLLGCEDVFIRDYKQSEAMFGGQIEYNHTLVSSALFVLGQSLFCCGVFGFCGVLMWRHRGIFIILYIVSVLVSLGSLAALLYVVFDVVRHQLRRLESYESTYREIVFTDYSVNAEKRDHFDQVQNITKCCGFLQPEDWFAGSLGYIPESCCKFDRPENCTRLGAANSTLSLTEASPVGCFAKARDNENSANVISGLFYGCITASGLLLQLTGLSLAVAYKVTNFSVIMRPTYSTHL